MVDTLDSGSSAGNGVEVRLLSRAPMKMTPLGVFFIEIGQETLHNFCLAIHKPNMVY